MYLKLVTQKDEKLHVQNHVTTAMKGPLPYENDDHQYKEPDVIAHEPKIKF